MSAKEKYTGRKLDELRKAPVSTFSGEEQEYFNRMTNSPDSGPGFFSRVIRTGLLATKAGGRAIGDVAVKTGHTIAESVKKEQEIGQINNMKDLVYRRANLETALQVGDVTLEEYENEKEALDELAETLTT